MQIDPAIASSVITAAGTIAVAAMGRLPNSGRGGAMRDEMELARMLAEMDDGSDEMRELRAELVRDMLDEVRARRAAREARARGPVATVAANYPFLAFFGCWLAVYVVMGGTFDDDWLLVTMLCCICCALDISAHVIAVMGSNGRGKGGAPTE